MSESTVSQNMGPGIDPVTGNFIKPPMDDTESIEAGIPKNKSKELLKNLEIFGYQQIAFLRNQLSQILNRSREVTSAGNVSSEANGNLSELNGQAEKITQEAGLEIEATLSSNYISDLLREPSSLDNISVESIQLLQREMTDKRINNQEFIDKMADAFSDENIQRVKEILGGSAKTKDCKISILREFTSDEQFKIDALSAQQVSRIFYMFKNMGSFEDVASVYERAGSERFKQSPIIRELYAVALNKIGRLEDSERMIDDLSLNGQSNGECAGILGKVYKIKYENLQDQDRPAAVEALKKSVDILEDGFDKTFESYPGINMVYNRITLGVETGNIETINRAIKESKLVNLAAIKAGGEQSADFWTLATLLESSVIADLDNPRILNNVLRKANQLWEIESPIKNLVNLKKQLESLQNSSTEQLDGESVNSVNINKIIENIDLALVPLENRRSILAELTEAGSSESEKSIEIDDPDLKTTEKIFKSGFSYGEIATFVSGNIEFGGQLQSHIVNRFDVKMARGIIESMNLNMTEDFEVFNTKIDELIRQRYNTEPLEDLHSPDHQRFDLEINSINKAMGIDGQDKTRSNDSRTNIMIDFYLGRGDCRQHAHTKQLLFDTWKTNLINKHLSNAYQNLKNGNESDFQISIDMAKELSNVRMLVFDSVVTAPIKMVSKYNPVIQDGKRVFNEEGVQPVEDHTWNGLVRLGNDGKISEFRMVDSFYQNNYRFGGQETSSDGQIKTGIAIDPRGILQDGFSGGMIDTVDGRQAPILLKPTVYAGDRETRDRPADELGLPTFRGSIINNFPEQNGKLDLSGFFDPQTSQRVNQLMEKIILSQQ